MSTTGCDLQVVEVCVELDKLLDPRQARVSLLVDAPLDHDVQEWW